jgi:ribosome-binding protein aMBF1 (putative translation factor)
VFEYFENKKQISEGKNKTTMLNEFFNVNKNEINDTNAKERSNVQKYLTNVDETFLDINNFVMQTDICETCNKGELIPVDHEGSLVCNNCSKSIRYLVENDKPSYKEPPKEVCFYAYKRINHFREILAQFQAKETTLIPDEVFENIKLQIKKERIKLNQITNKKAKEILKKLGYNKYYEHIPFIKDKLGIKPPIMSAELEERLCNLFTDIQGPYARYCPDDRVNFLNYYYTVYKLCELLDQRQFLSFFPMLKDREKRIEQDEIWKKICEELDWEFIPTI